MGIVSQRLRDSARGQECTLQFPCCKGGTETTVLCHLPSGIGLKGTGMKTPDYWAVFGCHACHDVLDKRVQGIGVTPATLPAYILRALQLTWEHWFDEGMVAVDAKEPKPRPQSKKSLPRKLSWQAR